MRATWEHLALRVLWYGGVLIGLPSAVVGIWVLAPQLGVALDPLAYLIVSQIVVALIILVLTARTVTNRLPNQRETELLTAVQTYQKFFILYEHSPVPYLILDKKGRIRLYNLAAVRMFATNTEGLRGQVFAAYLQHQDTNFLTTIKRNIADRTVIKDKEVQLVATNGAVRWVLLSVFVDDISTEQLVSLVDITRQKELDAIKSEFVALATHQLRTPIAAIRWNAELLQKRLAASTDASLGVYAAFIVSLFVEMYGVPLTVYITSAAVPSGAGLSATAGQEVLVEFEMLGQGMALTFWKTVGALLIVLGTVLIAWGWGTLYRTDKELVTSGIYNYSRHPQYLGFLLFLFGWFVHWPSLLTIAMFPVLAYFYYRLSIVEEQEVMETMTDKEAYQEYINSTPRFI